jgi:hypothetical protein
MVTALRPLEVRAAAADAVPKLAAVLADAFINDPVFSWLLPGSLRREPRLRTMFAAEMEQYVLPNGGTVWTTSGYDGAVTELPPGAWEMPKSLTLKETLKWMRAFGTRLALAIRVQHATEKRHLPEPHFYVRTVGVRTGCRDRAWDRRSCSQRWREPTRPGYRRTSRPAASAARHCTSGSASCTWMCLSCQKADRRFG